MNVMSRLRRWFAARLRLNTPGWGSEPQDDAHAYYRTQYERLLQVLPRLPQRSPTLTDKERHEVTSTFLAFSHVLQELHDLGDNPIMPPGIRKLIIRENQTRLQAFGEVGQPSFMGRMAASLTPFLPYILIGGVLVSVTGWGGAIWNGWQADRFEAQRDQAREAAEQNASSALSWRAKSEEYRLAMIDAANVATEAAAALTAERDAQERARARERRRTREIANVLANSPEPPAWSLRDDEPAQSDRGAEPNP